MTRSLKIIQTLSKIMRVLTKIGFIFCIIGTVGCLIGTGVMFAFDFDSYMYEGMSMSDYIYLTSNGMTISTIRALCLFSSITCLGTTICLKIENSYFEREVKDGTPFTYDGAKMLKSVAIKCLVIAIATIFLSVVSYNIMSALDSTIAELNYNFDFSPGWYLFLLFLSFVFEYGAEQRSSTSTL